MSAERHVIVLLLRLGGAESLASLDQVQTGPHATKGNKRPCDLAILRSYVDRRMDPAADPERR